jgi:hypothetical protein
MNARQSLQCLSLAVCCLLITSCYDSKQPLSDPLKSKSDPQLVGLWRHRDDSGETTYYHLGRVGDKLPAAVLHVTSITHTTDGKLTQGEFLVFPTVIGEGTYLNCFEGKEGQIKQLEEKGWNSDAATKYTFMKYRIDGDIMTLKWVDGDAKTRFVKAGKIKGASEKDADGNSHTVLSDTTENLVKFLSESSGELFSKDELRLERMK